MSRTETVTITNMCMIYDDDGNVLVQERTDPDYPGITFPGGHVEKGESLTDAVIREIEEETGLTIKAPRLCGVKDWYNNDKRYVVLLYKTNKFSGDLHSSDEGEVFWLNKNDLGKYRLAKYMDKMLRLFCEDDLSELWFCEKDGKWKTELK